VKPLTPNHSLAKNTSLDLGTSAIILGMIAAAVYVLETTCKYGPAILKQYEARLIGTV